MSVDDFLSAPAITRDGAEIDRRRLLQTALALASTALLGAGCKENGDGSGRFDTATLAILGPVCEAIIPRTDTPGALDVDVPERFDAMMADWASPGTRQAMQGVLDSIAEQAVRSGGQEMARLSRERQGEAVAQYDEAHGLERPYVMFKALVLTLYYMSEAGATQELRYEQVPGVWQPSIPVSAETRSWAVESL